MVNNKTWAIIVFLGCIIFFGCGSKKTESNNTSETQGMNDEYNNADIGSRLLISTSNDTLYINSVKGHDEKDTIIGNFTGNGIDTLFVERVVDCNCNLEKGYNE